MGITYCYNLVYGSYHTLLLAKPLPPLYTLQTYFIVTLQIIGQHINNNIFYCAKIKNKHNIQIIRYSTLFLMTFLESKYKALLIKTKIIAVLTFHIMQASRTCLHESNRSRQVHWGMQFIRYYTARANQLEPLAEHYRRINPPPPPLTSTDELNIQTEVVSECQLFENILLMLQKSTNEKLFIMRRLFTAEINYYIQGYNLYYT